jgi:hypothetical protein
LLAALLLTIGVLSKPRAASAQERRFVVGGFRASIVAMDTQRDALLSNMGYQLSGYFGRNVGPDFAWVVEGAVTTVSRHTFYPPCVSPGCTSPSSPGDVTGLSLGSGVEWYTVLRATRAAFTLTPGAVWFVNSAAGTRTVTPRVGGRLDLGWTLGDGPRVGLSLGAEWWGSNGTMPRWAIPFGLRFGFR